MIDYNLKNIHTLAIYTPSYKPSALSIERKAKLPNAPELITPDMLTDVIFKVAKEDEVTYMLNDWYFETEEDSKEEEYTSNMYYELTLKASLNNKLFFARLLPLSYCQAGSA